MQKLSRYRPLLALLFLFLLSPIPLLSQTDDDIILQLVLPDRMVQSVETLDAIEAFEADHEGIAVQLVSHMYILEADNLDQWKSYVRMGDVLYVETGWFDAQLTRTGYLLDLQPIYEIDELAEIPAAGVESFAWDGGHWAHPASIRPITMNYDTAAFDAAGLAYPAENWSVEDMQLWAETFAESSETAPIFVSAESQAALIRYLVNSNFYDSNVLPLEAELTQANTEAVLAVLSQMLADNLIEFGSFFSNGEETTPIRISDHEFFSLTETRQQLAIAVEAAGFAASSGTEHPDLAYELISYLVQNPSLAANMFGFPVYADESYWEPYTSSYRDSLEALNLSQRLVYRDTLFADALIPIAESDEPEIAIALEEAEIEIAEDLLAAETRQEESVILNAPEIRVMPENGVLVRFGIMTNLSPHPTEGAWKILAREFVEANPDVGAVEIEIIFGGGDMEYMARSYDCFYNPSVSLSSNASASILPLTPLIDTDPTLSREDFMGGTLELLTRDNHIWAFPLELKPLAMWMNADFIAESGLDTENPLIASEFFSVLQSLPAERRGMISYDPTGTYLLLLSYLFDGMVYDYSVYPPEVDFTSSENVEAIRSLLALIEAGTISYVPPNSMNGTLGLAAAIIAPLDEMYSRSGELIYLSDSPVSVSSSYHPYMFPRSNQYSPISYDFGAAYISADSAFPEECYRFISAASQEPILFSGMPARISALDSETLDFRPEETVQFYRDFAEASNQPETIVIPAAGYMVSEQRIYQDIFHKMLDLVITEGRPLEEALAEAQNAAEELQHCLSQTESFPNINREDLYSCEPFDWIYGA